MPIDLGSLLQGGELRRGRSATTAVLTMELQRGVVGNVATFPALRDAVAHGNVAVHTAALCRHGRALGWPIVHCLAEFREDWAGSVVNSPLHAAMARIPGHLVAGTPATELIPEIAAETSDFQVPRLSGVSPFCGTALDQTLRSMDVTVLVVTGVSVNLGVLGLCIEAVNLGYQVVLATDAVAGTPLAYAESVMRETLSLICTLATTAEIIAASPVPLT